ncbi:MAG: replication-associated recombination protein A [Lachnospirales bacterium]
MSIFDINKNEQERNNAQLATKMRPDTLETFYGQKHIVGKGKLLYRMLESNRLTSIILYGPSGTGKTTLANIISKTLNNTKFISINATISNTKEVKDIIDLAEKDLSFSNKRTVLFIDEIHRFSKSQQDLLLPHVESGLIILIGATTENPYFEVNGALLSRSTIFSLEPLIESDIIEVLKRAIIDKEKGLGVYNIYIDEEVLEFFASMSNGDARVALNALEIAVLTTNEIEGVKNINIEIAENCIQKKVIRYDKKGDMHYNIISAFIKSIRGSDPNAALFYLSKMLLAGEDIMFIARRMVISASEDIGNADPYAITMAVNCANAVKFVGMPEARIILAQCVTYLATAKKTNESYVGIKLALEDAENITIKDIPNHLKDNSYKGAKKFGFGSGYIYPHNYPYSEVEQQYLPDEVKDKKYYDKEKVAYLRRGREDV